MHINIYHTELILNLFSIHATMKEKKQGIRNEFLRVLGDMPSYVGMEYTQHSNCELVSNHVGTWIYHSCRNSIKIFGQKKDFLLSHRVSQKNLTPARSKTPVLELKIKLSLKKINIKPNPHKGCKT